MRKQKNEVLVVGAGPIGQSLGVLLAQRGLDVRVIDEEETVSDGGNPSVLLHPATLDLLDEMGVAGELVAHGQRIESIDFMSGERRHASIDLARLPAGFPFALTVSADDLEAVLERRLHALGQRVRWGFRFAGIDATRHPVVAEIEELENVETGYAVLHREGVVARHFPLEADYVVGADGPHSVVRRRMALPLAVAGQPDRFAIFEGRSFAPPRTAVRITFHHEGTAVYWPLPGGRWRWLFDLGKMRPEETPVQLKAYAVSTLGGWVTELLDGDTLEVLLARRAPWFSRSDMHVDAGVGLMVEKRMAERFGDGSVWLAGDAAHLGGPLSSQSLNVGLQEARDLAGRLMRILRGDGASSLLSGYGDERVNEWRGLLGLDGVSSEPRASSIGSFLPATGADLGKLMEQLSQAPLA